MPYNRTIVCLANSIKHHPSRCIAGKEWSANGAGQWVRPVADYRIDEGAISPAASRLQDGSQPQLLDVLQIPLVDPVPHGCQVENHMISGEAWQRKGKLQWIDLQDMVEDHLDVWGSGNSSRNGLNDRLSLGEANLERDSLRLMRPENFRLVVSTTGAEFNNAKKGMRALFNIGRTAYSLKVTDPRFTDMMRQYNEDVEYSIANCVICVSISESFKDIHYKLIAAIFTP
jgi:hypothetical protein